VGGQNKDSEALSNMSVLTVYNSVLVSLFGCVVGVTRLSISELVTFKYTN